MKKHIITIGGRPGSGKSTTTKELAELLGYGRFSSGRYMRELAKERGLSIGEFNVVAESDPAIDQVVDQELRMLGETGSDLIIDSRLAFHWIPDSFKVYLDLPSEKAAERIFRDQTHERAQGGELHGHMEDTLRGIKRRLQSEQKRYKDLYNVDPYEPSQFDLVIDTSDTTPTEVATTIAHAYKNWLAE